VVKRLLDIFSLRMRRNGYLGTSDQQSDPAIRSGDIDFLLKSGRLYFHYPMTFSANIWCFVHKFHLTLWPWPSTFWPWRCLKN